MNLSGAHNGSDQLRKDLNVLTHKFRNASGKSERIKLLTTMTAIVEELHRLYTYTQTISTL